MAGMRCLLLLAAACQASSFATPAAFTPPSIACAQGLGHTLASFSRNPVSAMKSVAASFPSVALRMALSRSCRNKISMNECQQAAVLRQASGEREGNAEFGRPGGARGLTLRRRQLLGAALGFALALPTSVLAAKRVVVPPPKPEGPSISLDDFYKALKAQEVTSVEFDGPSFERAYVMMNKGGDRLIIGEGYPLESPINSSGPQQVLAVIKNEMKAGNSVTWSWKFASSFKNKKKADDKVPEGKDAARTQGEEESKKKNGFSFSLPSPPKSL